MCNILKVSPCLGFAEVIRREMTYKCSEYLQDLFRKSLHDEAHIQRAGPNQFSKMLNF